MGKVVSFEDFEFNKATKILADDYFDFIGFIYSHELYDSDRYNHTKIIDIKYLDKCDKEMFIAEFRAYHLMHFKYPKSYPLDRNWSIEFLPHFQDPKKMAKLTSKERKEIVKKEKYELLKEIYPKKDFLETLEEMDIDPLKYEVLLSDSKLFLIGVIVGGIVGGLLYYFFGDILLAQLIEYFIDNK